MRYNVKIDGEIMPGSYTYEELREKGVFDFDDIEIKLSSTSTWSKIRDFHFCENIEIDEYGQVRRSTQAEKSSKPAEPDVSASSTSVNANSSDDIIWKVIGTIAVVAACVAILMFTEKDRALVLFFSFLALGKIWD